MMGILALVAISCLSGWLWSRAVNAAWFAVIASGISSSVAFQIVVFLKEGHLPEFLLIEAPIASAWSLAVAAFAVCAHRIWTWFRVERGKDDGRPN